MKVFYPCKCEYEDLETEICGPVDDIRIIPYEITWGSTWTSSDITLTDGIQLDEV